MKKIISLIAIILVISMAVTACGGKSENNGRSESEIIEELVIYYATYGDESKDKVNELISEFETVNKTSADKWKKVIDLWRAESGDVKLNYDVLPDGLPDDNSLCLVALGFQLNPDGTMKEELLERLRVVLASAEKYPNSYVVCTGGGTAKDNKNATESGEMAKWLIENGVDEKRVIVEDKSVTTAQNAIYTYEILKESYPSVTDIAIISSDYHIATGELLFGAQATLIAEKAGAEKYKIVSNAAYKAPSGTLSVMFQAGALIELSGDVETAFEIYYDNYDIHELPPLE